MDFPSITSDPAVLKAALAAAVVVLVEVIKRMQVIPQPERWLPAIAVVFGIGLGLYYQLDILESIMIGSTANGFFELGKRAIAGRME